MPHFDYHALDSTGQTITGTLEAATLQHAITELESQGLTLQSIGLQASDPDDTSALASPTQQFARSPRQPTARAAAFDAAAHWAAPDLVAPHLARMLTRGNAIAPAVAAYAEDLAFGQQRRQLQQVSQILARGDTASAAAHLIELPECWIPLLGATQASAAPGRMLREFLAESRRMGALRKRWWTALLYPLLVLGLALVVLVALSLFVIPEFAVVFREFDLALPRLTQNLVAFGHWLSVWGVVLLVLLAAAMLVAVLGMARRLPDQLLERLGSRIGLPFGRRAAAARLARFTADLVEADIALPDALRIAGSTVSRTPMRRAAVQLAHDLETAQPVSKGTYDRPLTAAIAQALTLDVPTPTRIRLLRDLSDCHAERVEMGLSWSSGFIEPLAICFVGCVVALVVLGLFLPLVSLVEGLSG